MLTHLLLGAGIALVPMLAIVLLSGIWWGRMFTRLNDNWSSHLERVDEHWARSSAAQVRALLGLEPDKEPAKPVPLMKPAFKPPLVSAPPKTKPTKI